MTSKEQLRDIASRAISDETFAARLQAEPEATLQAEGISLSDQDRAELKQVLDEAYRASGRENKMSFF
ncbi:MAG: hypothetical protein LC797_14135 [Chloroflexi bacterium]|nr:hypothetical protein [Chloroflexota bacterium]